MTLDLGKSDHWRTKRGDALVEVPISSMTYVHLQNTIRKLRDKNEDDVDAAPAEAFDDVYAESRVALDVRIEARSSKIKELEAELTTRPEPRAYRRYRIRIRRPSEENPTWSVEILKWHDFRQTWRWKYGACGLTLRDAIREFRGYNPYWSEEYHGR